MTVQTDEGLRNAYRLLEEGKPSQAKQILADALQFDLDNAEVKFALWGCNFWGDFIAQLPTLDTFERGEAIISRWKQFRLEMNRYEVLHDRAIYAIEKGIFTIAHDNYLALLDETGMGDLAHKAEILRKAGFCCKKLGNYADALNRLTEANACLPSRAAIIAEMADCYALCGEEKNAKVLFREAFFVEAQDIDLALLDSELIRAVIRKVQEKGYEGAPLQEWIPVYGVLYGVFSVKRQLRSQEVGKLKQDIYALENERSNPSSDIETLTPKLINRYFWLIDHYVRSEHGREKTNEVLVKIKMLDRNIYGLYNLQ